MEIFSSSPASRILYVWRFISPFKLYTGTGTNLSRSPGLRDFAGPLVTSVGGTSGGITSDDPEVANSLSGGGFSAYFPRPDFQGPALTAFFESPSNYYPEYYGFFKCVRFRGLAQPILTMKFVQPPRSRRPRYRFAIVQLPNHLESPALSYRQHQLCDTRASYSLLRPSTLFCSLSSPSLSSNEQPAAAIFTLLNDYVIF